ncbi:MAG: CvpA family protein [Pirellulales bacterium]|nr:CvpA family protein [Pirellulales bacterium]
MRRIYFDRPDFIPPSEIRNLNMQTYDLLMTFVLAAATLFGFWKGMAWQVASLASLVVSYFTALQFADDLAPKISHHAPWNKFVAMLAIYIATSFAIWTLFRLVSGMIDRVKLDGFDHQMGGLIGFAKGVLLCIAITFFAVTILPQNQKDSIIASQAGQYIVRLLDKTHAVVPPEVHEVIHPYVERIEQRLDPNYRPGPGEDFQALFPHSSTQWPSSTKPERIQPQPASEAGPSVYETQPPAWPTTDRQADRPARVPL